MALSFAKQAAELVSIGADPVPTGNSSRGQVLLEHKYCDFKEVRWQWQELFNLQVYPVFPGMRNFTQTYAQFRVNEGRTNWASCTHL